MSKRIAILTVGTRGDVQPYLALALGLQQAGNSVTLVTAHQFREFVEARGVPFRAVSGEALELGKTEAGKQALSGKVSTNLIRQVMPMLRRMLDELWAAVQDGADLLIYHPKTMGGPHLGEKLGIPTLLALPAPAYTPTRAFPSPLLTHRNLGGWINRSTYHMLNWAMMAPYQKMINDWRRETLKMPPAGVNPQPVGYLYPVSPHVVPTPPDWGENSLMSGYWFLDRDPAWSPPQALEDFLAAGSPPVYVGFGSMPSVDAERVTRLVITAVRQSGARAILAAGEGGMLDMDAGRDFFFTAPLPHDWLFPRVAAVVHHGGAGTTSEGLRAGKPTLICPFFGDQPFWGERVAALGVGPKPIPQKQLTAEALSAGLEMMLNDTAMQSRAAALGEEIRKEDGVACAVRWLKKRKWE